MSEFDNNNSNIGRDSENESDSQNNYSSDNYYAGYTRGENGEYSYVFSPKKDSMDDKKKKRVSGRYIAITLGVAVIVVAMFIGSFAVGLYSAGLFGDGGKQYASGDGNETSGQSGNNVTFEKQPESDETFDDVNDPSISVEKHESIKSDDTEGNYTSTGAAYNSVTQVYYKVADSVVEITTETVQNSAWMGQYVTTGAGSGVIIEESGYIVTNNHVIEGANSVTVRLSDGTVFEASLVGTDADSDIAVIKIEAGDKKLVTAELGCSADLVVGEDVIAIGNPLGSLGGTLTTGIISATERNIIVDGTKMVLLQTNAAINPGNSGGGLFNMAGQLIGVVNAKAAGEEIEGIGFAIPIDTAHGIIEELIHYGYVRGKVDHGLTLYDVTDSQTAWRYFGTRNTGVFVYDSKYSDDFEYGDRIVSVEGIEVSSSDDVNGALKNRKVGDEVTFTVARKGSLKEVKLTLQEYVPDTVSFDD